MSAGTIWTIIIVGIILLVLAVATLFFTAVTIKGDSEDRREGPKWILGCLVAIVAVIGATIYGMWPLSHEYHYWIPKAGTVNSLDSRLVPSGSDGTSIETKFVVSFVEDPTRQQYGVLDTRAAGLKVGDRLTITCKREWQFSGTDGYDCNFVDYTPAKR